MVNICIYSFLSNRESDKSKRFNYRRRFRDIDLECSSLLVTLSMLSSHVSLKADKARIRLKVDDSITEYDKSLLVKEAQKIAKHVDIRFSRPCRVEEWMKEIREVCLEWGENCAIFWHYNHDHPLISTLSNSMLDDLEKIAEADGVILASHYPEMVTYFDEEYKGFNLKKGKIIKQKEPKNIQHILLEHPWKYSEEGWGLASESGVNLQGEVVCNGRVMLSVWSSLGKVASNRNREYVARPDWDLVEGKLDYILYLPPIELYAHFDGYGHATHLTEFVEPLSLFSNTGNGQFFQKADDRGVDPFVWYFKRKYYMLLNRLYYHSKEELGLTSGESRAHFHEQIQRICVEYIHDQYNGKSAGLVMNEEFHLGIGHKKIRFENLNQVKAYLMENIDIDLPKLSVGLYS